MTIRLKYFGVISEITQIEEEVIHMEAHMDVQKLQNLLMDKYAQLNSVSYKVAINESIENENIELKENDLVALLPPFAGG